MYRTSEKKHWNHLLSRRNKDNKDFPPVNKSLEIELEPGSERINIEKYRLNLSSYSKILIFQER